MMGGNVGVDPQGVVGHLLISCVPMREQKKTKRS